MSALATSYRLFYPDSNTVTALTLFDGAGVALTPASVTDDASPPAGFKAKDLTFAEAVEAVFANPTFRTPASPVPVYLCAPQGADWLNVVSGEVFNSAAPGRPTARGEHAINYTRGSQAENGRWVWLIKTPTQFAPKIKQRTKDPNTGAPLYGNDFSMLWYGVLPNCLEVQCDVEDIADPSGYIDVAYTNATTYAESSVGLSMVRLNSEIIPQDGFSHALKFRIRYNCGGDVSPWVEGPLQKATYTLPPPNPPTTLTATVLRDRIDTLPDRVKIEWQWAAANPGDAVEIYAIDYAGKKHLLGEETDNTITSMTVENISRFVTQNTAPATQSAYRFGVLAKNRTTKSAMATSASTYLLTNKVKDIAPPTPDEQAGTAEVASLSSLVSKVQTAVANASHLTAEQKAAFAGMGNTVIMVTFEQIKAVIMKGGSVTVDNFGAFHAKWSQERWGRNPSTGAPVLITAARGCAFSPSKGYQVGTKYGLLMTDAEAKSFKPAP